MRDNERCDWREVLEAHSQCTTQRMTALPVALCLTDTTELDFNGQTIAGLGWGRCVSKPSAGYPFIRPAR